MSDVLGQVLRLGSCMLMFWGGIMCSVSIKDDAERYWVGLLIFGIGIVLNGLVTRK